MQWPACTLEQAGRRAAAQQRSRYPHRSMIVWLELLSFPFLSFPHFDELGYVVHHLIRRMHLLSSLLFSILSFLNSCFLALHLRLQFDELGYAVHTGGFQGPIEPKAGFPTLANRTGKPIFNLFFVHNTAPPL